MNAQALEDLEGKLVTYQPVITGDFPIRFSLGRTEMKVGAQIMFVKNDLSFDKHYFNGKMGVIKSLGVKRFWFIFPKKTKL
jgi:ATP-dependent exoDNAse (exonuclease V) alpha subunit